MQPLPIPHAKGEPSPEGWRVDDDRSVSVSASVADLWRAFDGERFAADLEAFATVDAPTSPRQQVVAAIQLAEEHGVLSEPDFTQLPLYSLTATRYRCLDCGAGCHNFEIGPLLNADIERLRDVDLRSLGVEPADVVVEKVVDGAPKRFLRKVDGACLFLDHKTNLCRVHAAFGAAAKPLACQSFPSRLTFVPGGLRLTLYSGCVMRHASFDSGRRMDNEAPWIKRMLKLGLSASSPWPRWTLYLPELATVRIAPGRALRYFEYAQLEADLLARLRADTPLFVALDESLRWLWQCIGGQPADSADGRAAALGKAVFRKLCGAFVDLAEREEDQPLTDSLRRAVEADVLSPLPASAELFARSLVLQEVWALRHHGIGGCMLGGLVLNAATLAMAVQVAADDPNSGQVPGFAAAFNRAHYRVNRLAHLVEVGDPSMLMPFARAPFLG